MVPCNALGMQSLRSDAVLSRQHQRPGGLAQLEGQPDRAAAGRA